jgi:hypothetical protein
MADDSASRLIGNVLAERITRRAKEEKSEKGSHRPLARAMGSFFGLDAHNFTYASDGAGV